MWKVNKNEISACTNMSRLSVLVCVSQFIRLNLMPAIQAGLRSGRSTYNPKSCKNNHLNSIATRNTFPEYTQ
jgi:hypothetical protein